MRIAEIFHSIQGEGMLAGMPSVFVRTSGCNLRCLWCDTKYAWDEGEGQNLSVEAIMNRIKAYSPSHCVLTGGEPMLTADTFELAELIDSAGLHLTIETNATQPPKGVKCGLASLSPKLGQSGSSSEPPIEEQIEIANQWLQDYYCQLKFVVKEREDLEVIAKFINSLRNVPPPERIFLMPRASDPDKLIPRSQLAADLCRDTGYRFGTRLQIELYGNKRGV